MPSIMPSKMSSNREPRELSKETIAKIGAGLLIVFGHILAYFFCGLTAAMMGADFHHWMLSWHPYLFLFTVAVWGVVVGVVLLNVGMNK